MKFADFLDQNVEEIVSAAEQFAATLLPAARHLDTEQLRDHIPLILKAISKDLRTPQTAEEGLRKPQWYPPVMQNAGETAAQTHALLRAKGGFGMEQLVAEYRALRASVLRLWVASGGADEGGSVADSIRFGETVDQALAESTSFFVAEQERWRHVFLGVLGHDLRGPLNAILLTSELLAQLATEAPIAQQTARLIKSGKRMRSLLDDLLDYSRASLGLGIGIQPASVDLGLACQDELEVLRSALPDQTIVFLVDGKTHGYFDGSRVREMLGNLVINAGKYGTPAPIKVRLTGDERAVTLSVENAGLPIPDETLKSLFEPLRRGGVQTADHAADRSNLGLGLFIVREIAKAHGGEVHAASSAGKTTFTVSLPRIVGKGET